MVNNRGRPQGRGDARERLLAAVQRRLVAGDLAGLSSRALARDAGVSHTLVNYHFGSRDSLVAEAMALRLAPHQVVRASIGRDGLDVRRLIRGLVALWEDRGQRSALTAFARAAAAGTASAVLVEYLQRSVFDRLAEEVGQVRARRIAVVAVGAVFSRYVLELPSMTALSRAELVDLLVQTAGERPRA